jgi:hypothetical protein
MEQPWWVYGLIALGCALLFLLVKVVENKVMKDDDDLGFLSLVIGIIGFFAAFQAADALKIFG